MFHLIWWQRTFISLGSYVKCSEDLVPSLAHGDLNISRLNIPYLGISFYIFKT